MADHMISSEISMALDMKKNRIRIHKPTLHTLGDPSLIQLLFNPETMTVVIKSTDREVRGGQEIRVSQRKFKGENEAAFYSKSFLEKLRAVHGCLADDCTYRLTGKIIPELRAAFFPLSTIQKVECNEGMAGNG